MSDFTDAQDDVIIVEFAEGGTTTVCTLTSMQAQWVATGEAKRMPNDGDDTEVGRLLALGRALDSMGEMLVTYAIARSHVTAH